MQVIISLARALLPISASAASNLMVGRMRRYALADASPRYLLARRDNFLYQRRVPVSLIEESFNGYSLAAATPYVRRGRPY